MQSNYLSCEDAIELLSRLHVPCSTVESDYTFSFVNKQFCEVLSAVPEQIIGKTFQQFTHPDDKEADTAWADRLISGEADSYQMGKRYVPFGSSLENPIFVYGKLYVWASRNQDGTFRKFLVAFDPQQKQTGVLLNAEVLKGVWSWSVENKKILIWIALTIASITGLGQTKLFEILSGLSKAERTVQQLEHSESLPSVP